MVLMAGVDLPVRAIREQVAGAVNMVIQQARLKDGSRRVTAISEVVGMESDVITMQDLFTFDYSAGRDEQGRFKGTLKRDRKSTRLNSSHPSISYAVFCLKKKKNHKTTPHPTQ